MVTPALELGSTVLPLELKVGAWRVQSLRGRGTYGIVYRAVSQEHPGPVALKLSVYPADERFEREVELLSRIRHPSVPRLLDAGVWQSPLGGAHPFIVMEWVEGEPLYAWAARRNPSSRQVLALLAQAAGALQAIHEVNAVHRDVKGDNMLVRPSDGRLFLTDLGAGYFAEAARRAHPRPRTRANVGSRGAMTDAGPRLRFACLLLGSLPFGGFVLLPLQQAARHRVKRVPLQPLIRAGALSP